MGKINHQNLIEILKNCLNKEIKEIYVTGYSEIRNKFNFFSSMNWWYYVEFKDFYLCVESSQTNGTLQFQIHPEIKCNFDIENNDIFTIAPINKENFSNQEIVSFDLVYSNFDSELFALGIQCKDISYLHKNNHYIFFNSLTFDGIEIGNKSDRDNFLEDTRFYLKKLDQS